MTDYVKSLMLFEVLYPPRGVATLPDEIIPQTTQFWTSNIVEALIHIHNQGVAYRDLKPENVLLTADGHVKLRREQVFGKVFEEWPSGLCEGSELLGQER